MTFEEKIILVRKQLKWPQNNLAKKIGTSAPIIGRHELEEITPSMEVASKLADALDVTPNYLLGKSENIALDKKNIFYIIDELIKVAKFKNIAAL